jgi:hypothetical protein
MIKPSLPTLPTFPPKISAQPSTQPSAHPSTLPPTQHGADNKPKTASETDYFLQQDKIIQIVPILINILIMLCISLYHIGNGGNKLFVFVFLYLYLYLPYLPYLPLKLSPGTDCWKTRSGRFEANSRLRIRAILLTSKHYKTSYIFILTNMVYQNVSEIFL